MTSKADFTDAEWTSLKRAPFMAGMAISLADPGGPIEAVKETAATLRTVVGAAEARPRGAGRGDRRRRRRRREAAQESAQRVQAARRARGPRWRSWTPSGTPTGSSTEKASPEEAAAFRDWLLAAAKEAADAAKEGGFMGWHAERVSEGEQRMLDRLAEVLQAPPA